MTHLPCKKNLLAADAPSAACPLAPIRLAVAVPQGVKVMWIAAGPAAFHSVIGDADGRCWTWGRNEVKLSSAGLEHPEAG